MKISARDINSNFLPWEYTARVIERGVGRQAEKVAANIPPTGRAEFETKTSATYAIRVECDRFSTVQYQVQNPQGLIIINLPVRPKDVTGFSWDEGITVPGVDLPELEPLRRGTLLNTWAKMNAVKLDGMSVASFVRDVQEVREDRILVEMSNRILLNIRRAIILKEVRRVSSAVGHEPPLEYANGDSVKTFDKFGNLQVSMLEPTKDFDDPLLADVDIDEEGGVRHALRVIKHHATGQKTDPIEVHGLLSLQGIEPGWKPLVT